MATINAIDSNIPIEITKGGTGAATLTGVLTGNGVSAITGNAVTQHGVLIGGASNAVSSLGVATNGQVILGSTGANPSFVTPTATAGGNLAVTANATTLSYGISAPVTIANGGTNAITMSTNTGIVKYDGTSLITSSTALIDSSNRYTNTSQPLFTGYLNSAASNVTGDGTLYQIVFNAEINDQNNNFDTATGKFTAPVTQNYHFDTSIQVSGLLVAHTDLLAFFRVNAEASSRRGSIEFNPSTILSSGIVIINSSYTVKLTAGDVVEVDILVSGSTKVVDILGSATYANASTFAGYLIC